MATATQFVKPAVSADIKLRAYITDQVTLRSQPAKLRKLFLKLSRDHRGRFDFTTFRTALLKIGCRTDVIDMENKVALKRVFDACASNGRMSWSEFAGKLMVESTSGLAETFTGRLQYGAGSQREIRRMDYRIKHQAEIRSGGAEFFKKIFLHRVLQRAFTHPSLELLLRKNDRDKDGLLTMDELHRSLIDIGVHDCSRSDVLAFAKSLTGEVREAKNDAAAVVLVPIIKLVGLCFEDPTKRPGAGAVFFSGGGSRTHERDCSVQPRGIHHAVNVVRQKICHLPGMDKENGVSFFFDSIDPDGDGEVSKSELEHALKDRLKITNKVLHPKDVRGLFEFLDKDGSHGVDRSEFIQVFGRDAGERKRAADAMLAGNRHETFVAGHTDAESVKRERARDQLLDHVRERVSLLCRERGLKDLWITKMCQGLRKGRLNSAGFKAGLRHLGCRGFGPGDSDLLFDFCVSHSPDNDHHSDGQGHVDIGFTSFSRVFSPDTFFAVETDKQLKTHQKHVIGILPRNPPVLLPSKHSSQDVNPAHADNVSKAYEITTNKMERIVKEKAWNIARSTAMGNSAVTNPNNLITIMRRFASDSQFITPKEFLHAYSDINGLALKNCVESNIYDLYKRYVARQNNVSEKDIDLKQAKQGSASSLLKLSSFVRQVVPSGIDPSAGSSAITNLFTGDIPTYDHKMKEYDVKKHQPAHSHCPWGVDQPEKIKEFTKTMVSNSNGTIGVTGRASMAQSSGWHVVHGKPFEDTGIFFNKGETAGSGEYATRTSKDDIGRGAHEGARGYFDVEHGGGFYEGIKGIKYGENIKVPKICKPTALGVLNFPNAKSTPMVSEFQLGLSSTARENWSEFRISPRNRRDQTLRSTNVNWNPEPSDRRILHAAPYAVQVVPRRPVTPLKPSTPSGGRKQMLVQAAAATAATAATAAIQTSNEPQEDDEEEEGNTRKANQHRSLVVPQTYLQQRRAKVADNMNAKKIESMRVKGGPGLQPTYTKLLSTSKGSYPSPRIHSNALRAAQAASSRTSSKNKRRRPKSSQTRTKRSFVPVVAMIRQNANFRGLHFKS